MDRETGVRIPELGKLRRDLKRVNPEFAKELDRAIKKEAGKVAADARLKAPRRSGAYARSIRVYGARGGASVGSRLPQAGVLHWGGTIRPRGVPITFKPNPVVLQAGERRMGELVEAVGDAVETAARKAGFK